MHLATALHLMPRKYTDVQTFAILSAPPTLQISAKCGAAHYSASRRILSATHLVDLASFDVHAAASIISSDTHNGVLLALHTQGNATARLSVD